MYAFTLALFFAFLAPLLWALMNIIDKFVIEHRVKDTLGFTVMSSGANLFLGIILALFLSWTGVTFSVLWPSIIVGVLYAVIVVFYMLSLEAADASHVIGIMYLYPVIVGLLAFLVLGETLSLIGYVAVAIIIAGVVLLSARLKALSKKAVLIICVMTLLTGVWEFMIKIAANDIGILQGTAIVQIAAGITLLMLLFIPTVRKNTIAELPNYHFGTLVVLFEFAGTAATFFAMRDLQAVMVSAIGTLQPLFLLGFEYITHQYVPMAKDEGFVKKLIAIVLIVLGVALLTMFGV